MSILEAFTKYYLETGKNEYDSFTYTDFPNYESAIDELVSLGIVYRDNTISEDIHFTNAYLKRLNQ